MSLDATRIVGGDAGRRHGAPDADRAIVCAARGFHARPHHMRDRRHLQLAGAVVDEQLEAAQIDDDRVRAPDALRPHDFGRSEAEHQIREGDWGAARQHRAEQQAVSRLAQLTASGCGLARSGAATDTLRQLHEEWVVSRAVGGSAIATDSVSWLDEHARKSLSLSTAIPC